jgi:hypothetical protein
MGIVAVGAQKVFLLSVPVAGSPAVNTGSPIPQLGAMALAAQHIGFFKIDQFAAGRVQHVAIGSIMTIHTPSVFFIVFKDDIIMEIFELSSFEVWFHIGMTFCARENVFAEGRWRNLDVHLFFGG